MAIKGGLFMTATGSDHKSTAWALQIDTPVVVLNTFHTGLAIGRDLGRLGIRVIGLTARREAWGNYSKWVESRPSPDSLSDPPELLSCLLELSQELGVRAVLLPTRDHDINFISENWEALSRSFLLPMLPPGPMRRVLNKDTVAGVARESGICVPDSVTITRRDDIDKAERLCFPCICKPVVATQWRKPGIWAAVGSQKVRLVSSFAELKSFYQSFSHIDPLVSVQEWVPGDDKNLLVFGSYCAANHEVTASFTARKLLQSPRLAGTGVAVQALQLPDLEEPARELLRRLQFHGISEIEFKRDERDGRIYLIEINPRHWDQHGLGTAVGVNLSEALYRDATGQPARHMWQSGSPRVWIGDLEVIKHFAWVLRGYAPVKDLAVFFVPNKMPSVFSLDDLRPFCSLLGLPVRRSRSTAPSKPA